MSEDRPKPAFIDDPLAPLPDDGEIACEFKLTKREMREFERWNEHHLAEKHRGKEPYSGAIGGRITFSFTGTSLGTFHNVECGLCGEHHTLNLEDID